MRIAALVTILGLWPGFGAPLHGQSLAEVARKEEDRRKAVKDSGKSYSNKDLKPVPAPAAPAATAPSPAAAADATDAKEPDSTKAAAKPVDKAAEPKDQKYWFGRMQGLREQLARDESYADALQSRINALTIDFSARDDPAQRSQIGAAREKALAELDRLRVAIADGTKAIADLEDEARRANVPPGWLR